MIEGTRIYLRAFDSGDISSRVRWMNNPRVREMLNSPFPVSEASTRRWLERLVDDQSREDFVICLSQTQEAIGYTGFRGIDFVNQKAEWYIGIGETDFWGQGYSTEACILALWYIFSRYNLNMVYSKIRSDNDASIRMSLRVGFRKDGVIREDLFSHGAFRDTAIMTILRAEFSAKHTEYPVRQ